MNKNCRFSPLTQFILVFFSAVSYTFWIRLKGNILLTAQFRSLFAAYFTSCVRMNKWCDGCELKSAERVIWEMPWVFLIFFKVRNSNSAHVMALACGHTCSYVCMCERHLVGAWENPCSECLMSYSSNPLQPAIHLLPPPSPQHIFFPIYTPTPTPNAFISGGSRNPQSLLLLLPLHPLGNAAML